MAIDAAFDALKQRSIATMQDAGMDEAEAWGTFEPKFCRGAPFGEPARGACFYDQRAMWRAVKGQELELCFLAYGTRREPTERETIAIGSEIVSVLHAHGLRTAWDGTATSRIRIPPFEWFRPPRREPGDDR